MVPDEIAKKFKEQMAKPDLFFITRENEATVSERLRGILAEAQTNAGKEVAPDTGTAPGV